MMNILEITGLHLKSEQGLIVRDLHISISAGQCHALIGESGSGKSMTSLSIGDLLPATVWVESGKIELCGRSLLTLSKKERERLRGQEIAYVFQDYASVFTPFITIGKQMDETLKAHHVLERKSRKERIKQVLEHVRLTKEIYNRYPFQAQRWAATKNIACGSHHAGIQTADYGRAYDSIGSNECQRNFTDHFRAKRTHPMLHFVHLA